jgi:hypothetical protein
MNKFKIAKINLFVLAVFLCLLCVSGKAYAIIGQSYNSMVANYGQPTSIALDKAINSSTIQKYQAENVINSINSYIFMINRFKIITLFN